MNIRIDLECPKCGKDMKYEDDMEKYGWFKCCGITLCFSYQFSGDEK